MKARTPALFLKSGSTIAFAARDWQLFGSGGPECDRGGRYFLAEGAIKQTWAEFLTYIKDNLNVPVTQGLQVNYSLGGIQPVPGRSSSASGYWDYEDAFTNYILNNVCLATVCN